MTWEWLDAARYADTNGYQGDPTRSMWYWRDWTVRAFNAGMPYDQFSIEQLAGDLLPNASIEQQVASGFHRNHMINGEGGRIAEESRVEYVQDRVETTGTVWLGLTLTCTRCHDHKFDPISQREYYQLAAFFNSIEESGANDAGGLANPVILLSSADQRKQLDEFRAKQQKAKQERDLVEQTVRAKQETWEVATRESESRELKWTPLEPTELSSVQGASLQRQDDNSVVVSGKNPASDDFTFRTARNGPAITAFRLEALPHPEHKNNGPGRASENGNFVLTEFRIFRDGKPVEVTSVLANFEQPGWPAKNAVDNNDGTGWAIASEFGKPHWAFFAVKEALREGNQEILIRLEHRSPHVEHVLGRFRISVTSDSPNFSSAIPEAVRSALTVDSKDRSEAQRKAISEFYLSQHPELNAANQRAADAQREVDKVEKSLPRTMVMRERASRRDTHILERGAYDKPGDKVDVGLPACLPQPTSDMQLNRSARPLACRSAKSTFRSRHRESNLATVVRSRDCQNG